MWAGMIGPVHIVSIFIIEGRLRVGYNSLAMYVSALSLGPSGWVQILNFVIFGLLLLAFARGVGAGSPGTGAPSRRTPSHVLRMPLVLFSAPLGERGCFP